MARGVRYEMLMNRYGLSSTVVICTAIAAVMFLSGCSHGKAAGQLTPHQKYMAEMKAVVSEVIPDPVRAEEILALMARLSTGIMDMKQETLDQMKVAGSLYADYNSNPEQLEDAINMSLAYRTESREKILGDYFELKSLMSKEEWEAVSKKDVKAMAEYLKTGGRIDGED